MLLLVLSACCWLCSFLVACVHHPSLVDLRPAPAPGLEVHPILLHLLADGLKSALMSFSVLPRVTQ